MKRFLVLLFTITFFITSLHAEDYSEMSTQELIAIMGYVKKENQFKFQKELKSRVPTMNENEKKKYQENLKKNKNK
ncbi:MAG: DUF1104 domain-containing protein [Halarcobacter sp.]